MQSLSSISERQEDSTIILFKDKNKFPKYNETSLKSNTKDILNDKRVLDIEYSPDTKEKFDDEIKNPNKNGKNSEIEEEEKQVEGFPEQNNEKFRIINRKTGICYDEKEILKENSEFSQKSIFFEKISKEIYDSIWNRYYETIKKFHTISSKNNPKNLKKFLDNEVESSTFDINFKDPDGNTALHLAIIEGAFENIRILISKKANKEAQENTGRTPLHLAVILKRYSIVDFLLEKGANVNAQDKKKDTPCHLACEKGFSDILQLLLSKSPDLEIMNDMGLKAYETSNSKSVAKIFSRLGLSSSKNIMQRAQSDSHIIANKSTPKSNSKTKKFFKKIFSVFEKKETEIDSRNSIIRNSAVSVEVQPMANSFNFWDTLGDGAFGNVYLASPKNDTSKLYAIKVQNKEYIVFKNMVSYVINEKNVMMDLNHPFIMKLRMAFQNKSKLFLVMDFASGGDMKTLLSREGRLSEKIAKIYISQIVLALEALHDHHIIYRDLKPANIVIDSDGCACLTDFGLAKPNITDSKNFTICGTPAYMAPELIRSKGYGKAIDWYTLGAIVYQMLTGRIPFYNETLTEKELYRNILTKEIYIPDFVSKDAANLIHSLMDRNPSKRLGSQGDSSELKHHPFFMGVDWMKLYKREIKNPPIPPRRNYIFKDPLKVDFEYVDSNKMRLINAKNYEFKDFNYY